jgi:hypothetical protein
VTNHGKMLLVLDAAKAGGHILLCGMEAVPKDVPQAEPENGCRWLVESLPSSLPNVSCGMGEGSTGSCLMFQAGKENWKKRGIVISVGQNRECLWLPRGKICTEVSEPSRLRSLLLDYRTLPPQACFCCYHSRLQITHFGKPGLF